MGPAGRGDGESHSRQRCPVRGLLEQCWRRSAGGNWPDCRAARAGGAPPAAARRRTCSSFVRQSFFENFYATLSLIKQQGINGGAVAPDLRIPMIATRDIADVAARALKARDWTGVVVRELLGPRDLTYEEATRIIGAHIGKPDLKYVQFPYADFASSLVQMGISANMAGLYVEMCARLQRGEIQVVRGPPAGEHDPDQIRGFRRRSGSRLRGGMRDRTPARATSRDVDCSRPFQTQSPWMTFAGFPRRFVG